MANEGTKIDDDDQSKYFHRSLSPDSFERFRQENNDYFYKPKRGPSTSKSNITITRPIKRIESVKSLVDLLNKTNPPAVLKNPVDEVQSNKSNSFSVSSVDDAENSLSKSSSFSSSSNSSLSNVVEQENDLLVSIEKQSNVEIVQEERLLPPFQSPTIGINIENNAIHLVLLELYPQNIDPSMLLFQRYLLSLIAEHEDDNCSISNVALRTQYEQEGNFRLFTLAREEFDRTLVQLQSFVNYNSSIACSFVLNIALTGEQTKDYERKISMRLNKINLNFDIIQSRVESYIIGLEFFSRRQPKEHELVEIDGNSHENSNEQIYPYLVVHGEASSTFFYLVHSSNRYSILASSNFSYKTYENLLKLVLPSFDKKENSTSSFQCFDSNCQDLCEDCYRSSKTFPLKTPLTSLTKVSSRFFPTDYSKSMNPFYIYRGWSNRRTIQIEEQTRTLFDVSTQTDDSFLQTSSDLISSSIDKSFLNMLTMNIASILRLILQQHSDLRRCVFLGELFQLEPNVAQDLSRFLRQIVFDRSLNIFVLKRRSAIAALGCALPRVYFDVINDLNIFGHDCIY